MTSHRAGALDLIAVEHRVALADQRIVVAPDAHVVAARIGVIMHPVDRGRNADGLILILVEMEQDIVADDVSFVVHGHELLGHVDREMLDAVDREIADQLQRIGAFDVQVHHVVALVVKNRRAAPGHLFVAPVGEFLHDARHDSRRRLRFPQKLYRVAPRFRDGFFEILRHDPFPLFAATFDAADS